MSIGTAGPGVAQTLLAPPQQVRTGITAEPPAAQTRAPSSASSRFNAAPVTGQTPAGKRPDDRQATRPTAKPSGLGGPVGAARMLERPGVWIEGPGYEVTYGASRQVCDQRCIDSTRCVMVEYYRPERKCNHYETVRPTRSGGASNVSLKTSGPAPTAAGRPDAEPVRRLAR